eukprot:TRINITY_DN54962_c0_g1_i1.p2 TRINITY_DN54962_c0_g1~~TRINITY_DN54962_c0_g1_i1.p2  ORF type:complete len:448 (+),score=76.72 TRINITY_DN54962_c0_g1_i1:90-1433(+)
MATTSNATKHNTSKTCVPTRGPASTVAACVVAFAAVVQAVGSASSEASRGVPQWKVDLTYNPKHVIFPQPQSSDDLLQGAFHGNTEDLFGRRFSIPGDYDLGRVYAPGASSMINGASFGNRDDLLSKTFEPITSTAGQDSQRCAVIDLPIAVALKADEPAYSRQSGVWASSADDTYASWTQNLWSQSWQTVLLGDNLGKLGARAVPRTADELLAMHGWQAAPQSQSRSLIPRLQSESQTQGGSAVKIEAKHTYRTYAVTDCEDTLMFVINLRVGLPQVIDVYDRAGKLAARAVGQLADDKHQFVDPNGYLLATATTMAGSKRQLHDVNSTGRSPIALYQMTFEQGGYENASRLLDQNFRWVLAMAMEVNALVDSYNHWEPPTMAVAFGVTAFFLVVLLACTGVICHILFRLVYPKAEDQRKLNPFVHKKQLMMNAGYDSYLGMDHLA